MSPGDIIGSARRRGWQPAETAPWGERDILVRYPSGGADVWQRVYGRPVHAQVTHWAELPGAPGEADTLQVALDWAEERDDYPVELRQRIADLLPRLRIATPWVDDEDVPEVFRRVLGGGNGELAVVTPFERGYVALIEPLAGGEPYASDPYSTPEEAQADGDRELRRRGWVTL